MKQQLRQYLVFSRAERMGLIALACLMLLLVATRRFTYDIACTAFEKPFEKKVVTACGISNVPSTLVKIDYPEHQDKHGGYSQPLPDKIDINVADSSTLVELIGVGPATTHKIIVWRTTRGSFTSVAQLREVGSFTEEVLNILGRHLRFSDTKVK